MPARSTNDQGRVDMDRWMAIVFSGERLPSTPSFLEYPYYFISHPYDREAVEVNTLALALVSAE